MKLLIGFLVAVILVFTAIAYVRARDDDYAAAARFAILNKRVKALSSAVADFRGDVVKDFSGTDAGIATAANRTMEVLNDAIRKQAMLIEGTIGKNKRASVVLGRLLNRETKSLEKIMNTFDLENKAEILRVLKEMEGRHVELVRYLSGGDMDRAVQDLLLRLSKDPDALSSEHFSSKEIDDSLQQYGVQLTPAELDKLGLDLKDDVASGVDLKSALYMRMAQIEPVMKVVEDRASYQQTATEKAGSDAFDALVRSNEAHREAIKNSLAQQHSLTNEMSVSATGMVNAAASASLGSMDTLLADQRDNLNVAVLKSLEKVQSMSAALAQVDAMDAATNQQLEARARLVAQIKADAEAAQKKAWETAEAKRIAEEAAVLKAKQDEENRVREEQERVRAAAEAQARALETRLRQEAEVREQARLQAVAAEAARQEAIRVEAARQEAIRLEAARVEAARQKAAAEEARLKAVVWGDVAVDLKLETGYTHEYAWLGIVTHSDKTVVVELRTDDSFGMTPFKHTNGHFYLKGKCTGSPGTYKTALRAYVNGVDSGAKPLNIQILPVLSPPSLNMPAMPPATQYDKYEFTLVGDATSYDISPVKPRFLYVSGKNVSGRIMESGTVNIEVVANKNNGVRQFSVKTLLPVQVTPFKPPTSDRAPVVQLYADDIGGSLGQEVKKWGDFTHKEGGAPVLKVEDGIKSVFFPDGRSNMQWIAPSTFDSKNGYTMAVRIKNFSRWQQDQGWFYTIGSLGDRGGFNGDAAWVQFCQIQDTTSITQRANYSFQQIWNQSGKSGVWNTYIFRYMPWKGVVVTNIGPGAPVPLGSEGHDGSWDTGFGRESWKAVKYPPDNINNTGQPNRLGNMHLLGSNNGGGGITSPAFINSVVLFDYVLTDAQVDDMYRKNFRVVDPVVVAWTVTNAKPVIWMDAASFIGGVWRDKSGRGNDSSRAEGVSVSNNALSGGRNSGVEITRGWPSGEYTFFHVTRYNGGSRGRIWNGKSSNWLSGHWYGHAGMAHHDRWLEPNQEVPPDNWLLTVDQRSFARFNATNDRRAEGTNPGGVGINQFGGQYSDERSDWACAEIIVFEGNLADGDIRAVESYLINKYGMPFKSVAPAPAPAPAQVTASWVRVASEHGNFNVVGTVRYGSGGTWTQKQFNGPGNCDNNTFGDPLPGTVKECQAMAALPADRRLLSVDASISPMGAVSNGNPALGGMNVNGNVSVVNLNGKPAFDLSSGFFTTSLARPQDMTLFYVCQPPQGGMGSAANLFYHENRDNGYSLEQNWADGNNMTLQTQNLNVSMVPRTLGQRTLYVGTFSGGDTRTLRAWTASQKFSNTQNHGRYSLNGAGGPVVIGNSDVGEMFRGHVHEVAYYNYAMSEADIENYAALLKQKWGI
jgi:hypothetical protein